MEGPNLLTWPTKISKSSLVLTLDIPGEPISKQRPRSGVTPEGKRIFYTPAKTAEAEFTIELLIREKAPRLIPDADTTFGIRVLFYCASRQRRDVDNMLKLILDAGNKMIWEDDQQVWETIARKVQLERNGWGEPHTSIVVYTLPDLLPTSRGTCIWCTKTFPMYPSWSKRKYCSQCCAAMAQRKRGNIECEQCGKVAEFPMAYLLGDSPRKYCSQACKHEAGRVHLTCFTCKKEFVRPKSLQRTAVAFCSEKCMADKWASHELKTKVGRGTCQHCGRPTSRREYDRCHACRLRQDPPRNGRLANPYR